MEALTEAFLYRGRRVLLREVVPGDAPLYLRWLREGVFRIYRPGLEVLLADVESTRAFLEWRRNLDPVLEVEVWVYGRDALRPRGLMGVLGMDHWHRRGELVAVFRDLWIRERLEALWLLVNGAFRWLGLEKLFFLVREEEKRFLRFLERLGLEPEAYLEREGRDPLTGERYGVYRFALFPETLEDLKRRSPIRWRRVSPEFRAP
ncbi:GNAT family N-acetyltransferase [Thermosulfurimonas sp. F29]|uniref:GNAT family N-acetyltransferase n=1 Tax=Thermosulfurimonas sp. F29 TaxID=2867247 RepID=UPI001C83A99B|nr:GNAT family protein [Thermosulfurimonas sp. F29]MBX6424249.1 GNAT family N-acetyltransferase [Thermosulfurimonas sp. F29]